MSEVTTHEMHLASVDHHEALTLAPLEVRQEAAAFWIGKVAFKGEVVDEELYDALTKFRGEVYVHELNFLPEYVLDETGRELDSDDSRSVNIAVVDNEHEKIVGSGRVIYKDTDQPVLPIEGYFPELFADNPIEVGSVEISRFIARHENEITQHKISLSVMRAMTYHVLNNNVKDAYCIIEKPLADMLSYIGMPMEFLAEPKDVPEYGGILIPVKIDVNSIISSLKNDKTGQLGLSTFFSGEQQTQGLGFFSETFMSQGE